VREHVAAGGIALAATHVDLGFGDGEPIDMAAFGAPQAAAPAAPRRPADDPFLGGDWA